MAPTSRPAHLTRAFGTAPGLAAPSARLAWQLLLTSGMADRTVAGPEPALLAAIGDVPLMLAAFALIAGATARVPPGLRRGRGRTLRWPRHTSRPNPARG